MRDDIEKAVKKMRNKFGSRREIKRLETVVGADELVVDIISGRYGTRTGLLILTERRLLFFSDGWTGSQHEDFPLTVVSSVGFHGGMLLSKIVIHASGNITEIDQVVKEEGKRIAESARGRIQAAKAAPAQATPSGGEPQAAADPMGQLKKLGELRDAGVLSDEEFAEKKTKLMDQI